VGLVIQPRLDRKICLLKRTQQRDAAGFAYETWDKDWMPEIWAGRERVTANDQSLALQTRATQIDKFRVRYMRCLESETAPGDYRVKYNGRTYVLISAVEDIRYDRLQWMLLTVGFVEGLVTLEASDVPAAV
jgi:head-tail adaptor